MRTYKPAGLATYKTRLNTGRSVIVIVGPIKEVNEFVREYERVNPRAHRRFEQYHYEDGTAHLELYIPEEEAA